MALNTINAQGHLKSAFMFIPRIFMLSEEYITCQSKTQKLRTFFNDIIITFVAI